MNAYVAYSIHDYEQYLLNLLAQRLATNGVTLVTSANQIGPLDFPMTNAIRNCAFFIGLFTYAGLHTKPERAWQEVTAAYESNRPMILLIEEGIQLAPWAENHPGTIRFNRNNVEMAMNVVKARVDHAKTVQSNNTAAAWLLGGVGILALLALLSDTKK